MKRSELRNFDIVELRDGTTAVVNVDKYAIVSKTSFGLLDEYDERLKHKDYEELDTMKVVRPKEYEDLPPIYWKSHLAIWERKEKPELSTFERSFLEKTGMKYMARNKNGNLVFFENEPFKDHSSSAWTPYGGASGKLKDAILGELFSFITWEDESPWGVSELLELDVEG